MGLIISHISAADFWRKVYPTDRVPGKPVMSVGDLRVVSSAEDIWQMAPTWVTPLFLAPECGVLHVLAFSDNQRMRSKSHVVHVCSTKPPPGSLYALSEDVYVCSPEFVFVQLAQTLDVAQLAAFGCEICGTYGFDEQDKRGFRTRKAPLVTKAQLERYIQSASGMRGSLRAREAMRFIAENCASPMETVCALLLTLPYRYGGYNLPKLLVNERIDLPYTLQTLCPGEYCVADLRVPGTHFVIEYLGEHDHAGGDSMRSDRGRMIALRELGYDVVEVTSKQVWDIDAFEIVAKRVSKACGKRIRSGEFGATSARVRLRASLRAWNRDYGRPSC